jgi:hypothetical protein
MGDQHFLSMPVVSGSTLLSPPVLSDAVSPRAGIDIFGPLQGGERVAWRGRCAVAEYAFDEAASPPRWTLPESTAVLVTDRRVMYAHIPSDSSEDAGVISGELRWLWPQHLRVQPGSRTSDRSTATPQIQLVCASADGSFPALVFAGGDLATIGDADRLANMLRHAIARFRVDNAEKLGLSVPQSRMLSRMLIGPEFSNYQGGEGQTVTLLGALPVSRPAPAPVEPEPVLVNFTTEPWPVSVGEATTRISVSASEARRPPASASEATRRISVSSTRRPSVSASEAAGHPSVSASESTGHPSVSESESTARPSVSPSEAAGHPSVSASESTRRISVSDSESIRRPSVSAGEATRRLPGYRPGLAADEQRATQAAAAEEATQLAEPDLASRAAALAARVASLVSESESLAVATPGPAEEPTIDLTARAEGLRRAAARFAANSARGKAAARRPDREIDPRGNRIR